MDLAAIAAAASALVVDARAQCVTYTAEKSVGGDALRDLQIGMDHGIVACNSARMNTARIGDLVIIQGKGFREGCKLHQCMIVVLTERADALSNTWAEHGGSRWMYCWKFTALTPIITVTPQFQSTKQQFAEAHGVKGKLILNSRLCPHNAAPVLAALAKAFEVQKKRIKIVRRRA